MRFGGRCAIFRVCVYGVTMRDDNGAITNGKGVWVVGVSAARALVCSPGLESASMRECMWPARGVVQACEGSVCAVCAWGAWQVARCCVRATRGRRVYNMWDTGGVRGGGFEKSPEPPRTAPRLNPWLRHKTTRHSPSAHNHCHLRTPHTAVRGRALQND